MGQERERERGKGGRLEEEQLKLSGGIGGVG